MIEKLNAHKIDDEIMDKIEGGIGTASEAKNLHLTAHGNILNFAKNVAGNNSIFTNGNKTK